MSDDIPAKRHRRTELACTACRQKKHRCDGLRPKCRPCSRRCLECVYEPRIQPDGTHQLAHEDEQLLSLPGSSALGTNSRQVATPSPTQRRKRKTIHETMEAPVPRTELNIPSANGSLPHICQTPLPVQTVNVVEDGLVDVLATTTFHDTSRVDTGYFGPSSNHFMFRSLSEAFVEILRLSGAGESRRQSPSSNLPAHQHAEDAPLHADFTKLAYQDGISQGIEVRFVLPRNQEVILLINHYFATTGFVLPYVDKASLMSQYHEGRRESPLRFRRGFFALITIVCALSLSSVGDDQSEKYYHLSLAALNLRCLRGSSVETLQALLLIVAYQQNNQHSISSWTTHALAVKAAIELGIHSPTVRQRQSQLNSELMGRLWTAIILNDGVIGMTLGRPGLVHPRFLQCQHVNDLRCYQSPRHIISVESLAGQAYLTALGHSSTLLATIVELLYDYNVEGDKRDSLLDRFRHFNDLLKPLGEWRERLSQFGGIVSVAELNEMIFASYDSLRLRILLSIHYYRLLLTMAWPIIIKFLNMLIENMMQPGLNHDLAWETFIPVVQQDWLALQELGGILRAITTSTEPFLKLNAAWFTCNYTSLTACLHFFVLLLISWRDKENRLDFTLAETRIALQANVDHMKSLERTSLMTYKARSCLMKLMGAFDTFENRLQNVPVEGWQTGGTSLSDFIQRSTHDFLLLTSLDGFSNTEIDYNGSNSWT